MSIENMDVHIKGGGCATGEQIGSLQWILLRYVKLCIGAVVLTLMGAHFALAQHSGPPIATQPPSVHPGAAPLSVDPNQDLSATQQQMKAQRNALRQRKLMEKTAQLQQLSSELKIEIDKTDKDTLSLDVIRKSEQIEKLAKSIHELMVTPL